MNPFRITSVSGARCRRKGKVNVSTVDSLSSEFEDTYNIVSSNLGVMFSSVQSNFKYLDWRCH